MTHLRNNIIGTILLVATVFSCQKVKTEEIPSTIILLDDQYEINQGQSIEIDFIENDILEGEELSISLLNDVENGKLSKIENSTKYLYKSNFEFSGKENFSYQVCADGNCKTANVDITINAIPDSCQPEAKDDFYTVKNGGIKIPLSDLISNDINNCNTWDLSTLSITKISTYGVVTLNNNYISYVSYNNSWRKDQFGYEICGLDGNCKTATVNLTNGDAVVETLF